MKTSTLRFVTVRNPELSHPIVRGFPYNPSDTKSDASHVQSLYKALDVIQQNRQLKPTDKAEAIRRAVEAFKSSGSYIADDGQFDRLYPGFAEFRDWLASGSEVTVREIYRKAEKLLRLSARKTLPSEQLVNLTDNLIAHIILNEDPGLRERISSALRINNIVQKAELVRGAADLRKLLTAPVILPDVVFPPPSEEEKTVEPAPKKDPAVGERQRSWEKLNQFSTAYEELAAARGKSSPRSNRRAGSGLRGASQTSSRTSFGRRPRCRPSRRGTTSLRRICVRNTSTRCPRRRGSCWAICASRRGCRSPMRSRKSCGVGRRWRRRSAGASPLTRSRS